MKFSTLRRRTYRPTSHSRCASATVLCLILALVTHSVEMCAAHLGGLLETAAKSTVANGGESHRDAARQTPHQTPDESQPDLCEATSEMAVFTSQGKICCVPPRVFVVTATVIVPPDLDLLRAASLSDRSDPPDCRLRSQTLLSPLAGRAPPLSA